MSRPRPLRVLFFVREAAYVRRMYAPLIAELAARGHTIELAFGSLPEPERVRELTESFPEGSVTCTLAPHRDRTDGWQSVAWLVRAVGDLARYAHPRYAGAPGLRRRVTKKVVGRLETAPKLEPLGRAVALRVARRLAATTDAALSARVIRRSGRLEEAIPTSRAINRFIRERSPGVVLVTPVVKYGSDEVEYLKSARRLGIPAAACVASWDNLTNKGLLKVVPERIFVWNEIQRTEAVELHGMPAERVVATGAQLFDKWFEQRPSRGRDDFMRVAGLDPGRPYLVHVCSSPFVVAADDEIRFVTRLLEALRSSADERLRELGVMVRRHPIAGEWKGADLGRFGNAVVWPGRGRAPVTEAAVADFYDSLVHSAAVTGVNTTAMIEAAIVGKSVLTVLEPEFAQESTLHFQYLLEENGGFLHVATSLDELLVRLGRVLVEDESGAKLRMRFVESFVRPRGIDRPATPILADAVEELAGLPVASGTRPGAYALRAALALEAAACSFLLAAVPAVRPVRLRVVGAARRYGLLQPRAGTRGRHA